MESQNKHYFEEGKRICSKIGGGFTNNFGNILYDHVQSLRYSYAELGAFLTGGIRMTFNKCLG
ncbi:MAG: hypothetical protein LBM25_00085, partial [Bacteroidales bacterium]|nr:hypothetical protein [Bacteroidales bacterium]